MPTTNARRADSSPSRGPAAAVRRAVASVSPIVTQWRDGLTIIALESREPSRRPDYLTFEQAQAADGIEVEEAPVQTVPTVDAATGPMPVRLLGGDTIVGGAQNRIINITILLKAAATTQIPVSCLELGR
ncbi:MAG: ARPP-1 family domain-containing protein [Candidatus Limnocylindria bacterium]